MADGEAMSEPDYAESVIQSDRSRSYKSRSLQTVCCWGGDLILFILCSGANLPYISSPIVTISRRLEMLAQPVELFDDELDFVAGGGGKPCSPPPCLPPPPKCTPHKPVKKLDIIVKIVAIVFVKKKESCNPCPA